MNTRHVRQLKRKPPFLMVAAWFALLFLFSACGEVPIDGMDGDVSPQDGDEMQPDGDSDSEMKVCINDDDCQGGGICDPDSGECVLSVCSDDADCREDYGDASSCVEGRCKARSCQGADDCPSDYFCTGGLCRAYPACDDIVDIGIEPILPLLRSTQERRLKAHLVGADGTFLSGAFPVEWQSMSPDVVSVIPDSTNALSAIVRGGAVSGMTTILARLNFPEGDPCSGKDLTTTLSIQNFASLDNGVRVIVVDSRNGKTLGGASVIVNGQAAVTPSEADKGVALFEDTTLPLTVHVFHPDYHYLSLIEIESNDIILPLNRFYGVNHSAGISAKLDFSNVPIIQGHDIRFGMIGMSYPRSLLDMSIATLFSSPINTPISMQGPFHDVLPIPSNVQVVPNGETWGHELLATGDEGSSVAWSFGGFIPSADFMEMVTARLYQGWTDVGSFLLSSLYFNSSFYHGVSTEIELTPSGMVPDNGEHLSEPFDDADLNGNGSSDDLIPNYDEYQALDAPIKLVQTLSQRVTLTTGRLPLFAGGLNGIFSMAGARIAGKEFLPLGLGTKVIGADDLEDKPSLGMGGDISMNFAPYYGGMYDEYVIAAYALPFASLFTRSESQISYSAILKHYSRSPNGQTINLGDFMEFVPYAAIHESERRVQFVPAVGANLHRLSFCNNERQWEILIGGSFEPFAMEEITLPVPPGDDPFGNELALTAAEFKEGQSLDYLAEFNALLLSRLDRQVKRYSLYRFTENGGMSGN